MSVHFNPLVLLTVEFQKIQHAETYGSDPGSWLDYCTGTLVQGTKNSLKGTIWALVQQKIIEIGKKQHLDLTSIF